MSRWTINAASAALLTLPFVACDYERKVLPGGPGADTTTATAPPDTLAPDTTQTPDTTVAPDTTPAPDTAATDTVPGPDTNPPPEWQHPEVIGVELGKGEDAPLDPLAPPPEVKPRGRARLDIDQLDLAFQTALGGITWTRRVGNAEVNQFKALSETLGVPDFIDTTVEDLAATPLFSKFLGDAARKACSDRLTADLAATPASGSRVLLGPVPAYATLADPNQVRAIEDHISTLILRFHGHVLRPDDPGFAEWRWLFESSTQLAGTPTTAWQAMCVALITHPDFYTY